MPVLQEYVTLKVVDSYKCSVDIAPEVELCVGGIAPRAIETFYKAKMAGMNVKGVYEFTLERVMPDHVSSFDVCSNNADR